MILGETFRVSMDILLKDELTLNEIKDVHCCGNNAIQIKKQEFLKYQIGNQAEKEYVCNECRKLGISNEQMNWPE